MVPLRLVEGWELELAASGSDVLPPEVAALIGSSVRELRTRGDGACGVHAALATLTHRRRWQSRIPGGHCGRLWVSRSERYAPACGQLSSISWSRC